jgi:hypothetical protein
MKTINTLEHDEFPASDICRSLPDYDPEVRKRRKQSLGKINVFDLLMALEYLDCVAIMLRTGVDPLLIADDIETRAASLIGERKIWIEEEWFAEIKATALGARRCCLQNLYRFYKENRKPKDGEQLPCHENCQSRTCLVFSSKSNEWALREMTS